jgi:hypothetical protein
MMNGESKYFSTKCLSVKTNFFFEYVFRLDQKISRELNSDNEDDDEDENDDNDEDEKTSSFINIHNIFICFIE